MEQGREPNKKMADRKVTLAGRAGVKNAYNTSFRNSHLTDILSPVRQYGALDIPLSLQ